MPESGFFSAYANQIETIPFLILCSVRTDVFERAF
ncbi:Uncharacterised protein [Vibrio cholerae]|nr:Uncharacterised protein [Vibrio cholerae]